MSADLIARVEAADEGSRELDCLIAKQVGWFRYTRELGCTIKRGGWIAPEDFRGTDSAGRPILDSLHGTTIHRDPPRFTRSLDDLRRHLLPDGWHLGLDPIFYEDEKVHDPVEYDAILCKADWSRWTPVDSDWIRRVEAHGKTAELAACAGVLKIGAEQP